MLGIGSAIISKARSYVLNATTRLFSKLYARSTNVENQSDSATDVRYLENNDLLSKATIILTPTGYEDGYLNLTKPIGDELITNGTFDADSDWTKGTGWTISGGVCSSDGTQTGNSNLSQTSGVDENVPYLVTYTVLNYTAGQVRLGWNTGKDEWRSANGTHSVVVIPTGSAEFLVQADIDFIGSVDNVSVKRMYDFTFTRSTTGTRVNADGEIETVAIDTPRIDYTDGTGAILLEPASTNLLPYSVPNTANGWVYSQATEESTTELAPDGTSTALLVEFSDTDPKVKDDAVTISSTGDYTQSIWIKGIGDSIGQDARFFSIDGTANVGGTTSTLTEVTGEWQRITHNFTCSGTGDYQLRIDPVDPTAGIGDQVYLWGGQVENLPYATSYIPTSGATVERTDELAASAGASSLINSPAGVLFAEFQSLGFDGDSKIISLTDGTGDNRATIEWISGVENRLTCRVHAGGVLTGFMTYDGNVEGADMLKVAHKWAEDDFAVWINGVEVNTDPSGAVPAADALTELRLHSPAGTFNRMDSRIRQVAVFNEALTDAELTILTT